MLFQPRAGPLLLFYKVGPSPRRWWGMMASSTDGGHGRSPARPLPRVFLRPIRAKPVQLADETLLCPSSTEHLGWRCHLEQTPDLGGTWQRPRPLNRRWFGAIQPASWTIRALEEAPGEYSYPAVIQGGDGIIHVTYTWNRRRIRHVLIAPDAL